MNYWMTFASSVSFILLSCTSPKIKNKIQWKETIGILETAGRMDWLHYSVNDLPYKTRFYWRNNGAVNGEKYIMRYNVVNPKEVEIDYWHPVFENHEKTIMLKGKITKVSHEKFLGPRAFVYFLVDVDNGEIKKEQTLPPDEQEIYPNLEKGQYYEVECDSSNLTRAIIHLDKPLN